ncbi:MAG: electron transport complex subunit RsxC [Rhodocyclaceae bacterium]
MAQTLFKFHGGVKPNPNKDESTRLPIATPPLPPRLIVPLHQHVGGAPHPLVKPGQKVLKGQRIGAADGNVSSAVHAPTSGTVKAVEPCLMPHPSGLSAPSVVIDADGEDRWGDLEPIDFRSASPGEVRDFLRDAGVVGLGGAVFPSHLKLRPGNDTPTKTLVLNGAECEPFLTCDDMLMREQPELIVKGAAIMRHLLQAQEVLIGIEDNKPRAIAAMQATVSRIGEGMKVVPIPTRYPAGGAKQLVTVLTGIEVPHGVRSTDYGVQCFNVGTAASIWAAVELGQPLISRIVTVAGNVGEPRNYDVLIGTPIEHLVNLARPLADTNRFIMGGPMMGFSLPGLKAPVVKATNCILAASSRLFPPPPPEMPCIRCTSCVDACPTDLQPHEMYWFSRSHNFGKAQEYNLFDCIECGCCSYVCPSHIPLVDYFRFAKSEIWAREREKAAADSARDRFEFRADRLEREKQEKAEKLAAKTAAARETVEKKLAAAKPGGVPVPAGGAPAATAAAMPAEGDEAARKKALVAEAIERAKVQKAATAPKNTEHLSPEQRAEIAAIEARRNKFRETARTRDEAPD